MITEIYLSGDVEADGKIPGHNSMLSFGISAITINKEIISSFTRNLKTLPNAVQDPETMEFWRENPAAWEAATCNPVDPSKAMLDCYKWIQDVKKYTGLRPVFTAFPGGYDFMFFHWYMNYFTSHNPCGWSVLCMKSYASAELKCDFTKSTKRNFPKRWFEPKLPHTHVAIDDATEQGIMAVNILRESRNLTPIKDVTYKKTNISN